VTGWRRLGALLRHDHAHGGDLPPDDAAIHATKVSLIALGVTAILQLAIVVLSGSVALLSDTIHNFADALTAIPLWIAFVLHKRPPSRHFTHGYNRAEDFAGLLVLTAIGVSAAIVVYESVVRLLHPRAMEHAVWVIAAGCLGALGNEVVARYRMRAGRRVGSAALTADGVHARTDALTSLVVVAAGIGAVFGHKWADPVAGLVVAVFILLMLGRSAVRIFARLLDAVDPELVDLAISVTGAVEGVRRVSDLRLRWHGHELQAVALVTVDPQLTVDQGHLITQQIEHELLHAFPYAVRAVVHLDPDGVTESHELTRHHR
jgi:cation diffusion facilitator family transporter